MREATRDVAAVLPTPTSLPPTSLVNPPTMAPPGMRFWIISAVALRNLGLDIAEATNTAILSFLNRPST